MSQQQNNKKDIASARRDFPVLSQLINGCPLTYLDSGASAQMPQSVVDRLNNYHAQEHANIHRGVYQLSERATREYEDARKKISEFLNARKAEEIIFTRGTTNAINLVANSFGREFFKAGDEIIISYMEHHSNIVPWQMLCEQLGTKLKVVPISDVGELDMGVFSELLNERTKLVAITHVSNVLGTVNPVNEITAMAHDCGAKVLIDGAQSAPHMPVDVQDIDCDFYVFSGHKMCGPTGIGVLYAKMDLLNRMRPYEGGGDMILSVSFDKTLYAEVPAKFEAGTPPIAAAIGLGSAVDYLNNIGMSAIHEYEQSLTSYAMDSLREVSDLKFFGTSPTKSGVISFNVKGIHAHDMGTLLNDYGVAVRTGHHCAQPVMERYKVPATTRASLYLYNTRDDIDVLVESIRKVQKLFN
jgi:cysteine desulfurase/selenocysteine lyase